MDIPYYLDKFEKAVDLLDKQLFEQKQLELKVGVWMDSVVLKIQKPAWLNISSTRHFQESVFFSVWINDEIANQNKLYYNIHALKLRELAAYKIQSRDFAEAFRARFKSFESHWPNVSTQFGPLTLMEGWVNIDINNFDKELTDLATKFLAIEFIIDDLLKERAK